MENSADRTTLIHRLNDKEDIIARYRRLTHTNITLLEEALHAANKGKLHVVIDHLERVLEDMKKVDL